MEKFNSLLDLLIPLSRLALLYSHEINLLKFPSVINVFRNRWNCYSPTEVQKWTCASRVFITRLLRVSQTRRVLSSEALTMNLPPGWKTMPRTQLSCPKRAKRQTPAPTSHTRITLSREPDARKGPSWAPLLSAPAAALIDALALSGAHAIHSTTCSWSLSSTWKRRHVIHLFYNGGKFEILIFKFIFTLLGTWLGFNRFWLDS